MKINKKMIDAVLKLNDEQLWNAIQAVAKKTGSDTVTSMEKPKDMAKIRSTLSNLTDYDLDKIAEMLKMRGNNE